VLSPGWIVVLMAVVGADRGVATQIADLAAGAGGPVSVSVVHVETGTTMAVHGRDALPLYSVFKLPLAVAVLKEVQAGRLTLEQPVTVTTDEVSPGSPGNSARWKNTPVDTTVRQLIEFSMVDSDNTASDKLLALVGGPAKLTKRLRSFGIRGIEIRASTREMNARSDHPNRASATAVTTLLVSLQRGLILRPAESAVLWDVMSRSRTGMHRLRGMLPPETRVLEKTGTGRDGAATNDVGLVTLPGDRGHLAIAVLIAGSKLPAADQERVIAQIARVAFDSQVAERNAR
jgi:beta-lactamase class A